MSSPTTLVDRANYFRLQALLIDGVPKVLRKVIDEKKTCSPLASCISKYQAQMPPMAVNTISNLPPNPSLDDCDITLLSYFIRYMCGLRGPKDKVWSITLPNPSDVSIEADCVRIRQARNTLAHLKASSALTPADFEDIWSEIEQVLVRLNSCIKNGVQDLPGMLNAMKTAPLDPVRETAYKLELDKWIETEIILTQAIDVVNQKLEELTISSSQQHRQLKQDICELRTGLRSLNSKVDLPSPEEKSNNLYMTSQTFFEDADSKKNMYVETSFHKEARVKLQNTGLVILNGHPGEGKTTMATHLLLEAFPVTRLLRLSHPSDWRLVDNDRYNAVLIDDIFGYGVLDEQLMYQWEGFLPEIASVTKSKMMSVVITTRHYIFKEARGRICRLDLFEKENVTTLSSSKLTNSEKRTMLLYHLEKNHRSMETGAKDLEYLCKEGKPDNEMLLGYPECVAMFASTESLFNKGIKFFSSPMEFFRKCLTDISKNENEFMALVIVWANASRKVKFEELERRNIHRLSCIGDHFDYTVVNHTRDLKKYLEVHKDAFLKFNPRLGEYSFSHQVISDVVGLVAAKTNPKAVVTCCSKDFILKYVTTECSKRHSEGTVYLEEFLYPTLITKLIELLYPNEENDCNANRGNDLKLRVPGIENTVACQCTDIAVSKHEAFFNKMFIQRFVDEVKNSDEKMKRFKLPLLNVFELFKCKYCIVFEKDQMYLYIPSLLLARGNPSVVEECLEQAVLTDDEKYISMLLATRDRNKDLVQKLIENNTLVNDDAIQIAALNNDLDILELLLENRTNHRPSHIQNKNSPLITATKRGYTDVVKCLLQGGVDVNYRNARNVSALDKALYGKHIAICQELLLRGANLNDISGKFQRTPIHTSADIGLLSVVRQMLELGADVRIPDHRGEYPIHSAAIAGHTDIFKLLLNKDRSAAEHRLSQRGKGKLKGMTLYHFAILNYNIELVSDLVKFKVNPDIQDKFGRTPLYIASYQGMTDYVSLLLKTANAEIRENQGYSPLHAAVYMQNAEIVRVLCLASVNANLTDKRGNTPLHLACKMAYSNIVQLLLTHSNADIRMRNRKGDTVIHLLLNAYRPSSRAIGVPISRQEVKMCIKYIFQKDSDFKTMIATLENRGEIAPILEELSDLENA